MLPRGTVTPFFILCCIGENFQSCNYFMAASKTSFERKLFVYAENGGLKDGENRWNRWRFVTVFPVSMRDFEDDYEGLDEKEKVISGFNGMRVKTNCAVEIKQRGADRCPVGKSFSFF